MDSPVRPDTNVGIRSWSATAAVALAATAVFVWGLADPLRVEDVLFLANAPIDGEPWRVLTSTFIHRLAPHFAFNLVTSLWFGRMMERRYGKVVFSLAFLGGLWIGQVGTLLAGLLPLHGLSGGACGLYGFLLAVDWRGNLFRTILQRASYWLYPMALLALLIADRLGITPVANLNHAIAIVFGACLGLAVRSETRRAAWSLGLAVIAVATTAAGGDRWERGWRDAPPLVTLECSVSRRPVGDVTKSAYVRITILDPSARRKALYYVTPDGEEVRVSAHSRRVYRIVPYVGSVWRIKEPDGGCRAQFEATESGTILL